MLTTSPSDWPVAAAYCSALAVADSTAASRAFFSTASGSPMPSRIPLTRTPLPPTSTAALIAGPPFASSSTFTVARWVTR